MTWDINIKNVISHITYLVRTCYNPKRNKKNGLLNIINEICLKMFKVNERVN